VVFFGFNLSHAQSGHYPPEMQEPGSGGKRIKVGDEAMGKRLIAFDEWRKADTSRFCALKWGLAKTIHYRDIGISVMFIGNLDFASFSLLCKFIVCMQRMV
jgi:hypothetical protein